MYFNQKSEDVLKKFHSCPDGLSHEQAGKNMEEFGENKLKEKKEKSAFIVFLEQFKDLLVIILIVAAIISAITGNVESTVVILAVLVMNSILSTVQFIKSKKSLDSLKKLSAPVAKVIRDGEVHQIPAAELVCGDIVKLEAGDVVPADGRILESFSLKVNESAMTGESEAVEKSSDVIEKETVALGDQTNMVFSSSLVTYGRGTIVITSVGSDTELGKIATMMDNTAERKTPLQVTMDNFSKKLSIGIILICIVVFGLSIYRNMDILDAMLFAIALAIAAIPEALSSIITISLAIGTSRMANENAIIKQLNAVEGLGCVSVICSDKTGTLTQNKMTVEDIAPLHNNEEALLQCSILCNDTSFSATGELVGDPTETALVTFYQKEKDNYEEIKEGLPRLSELPFDSDRKLMSTLHLVDGRYTIYTKGAPDMLLGRISGLSEKEKEDISVLNSEYSKQGLRVLAFARKIIDSEKELTLEDEHDLEFLGLMAEMDPPREESAQAVADCINAGIKPIMITGDHKITASAIAERIGILQEGDIAVTGLELDAMSDEELYEKLPHISVYARVSPDNKIRIVQAWQEMGHIVSMTGDGVNDAPALKNADVGIAMGITGTEVSKDAASMILTDDNFATIIKSVLNGRNIYENIKNAIVFLLSGNAAAILVVLFASLLGLPTPFTAVQLLFINLITDSLPALAISMEPSNPELIHEKPRARSESVLTKETLIQIGYQGVLIAIATVFAFFKGLETGPMAASTMAFATLCLARLWHGFNSRGKQSIFKLGITTNIYTIGAFVLGAALLFAILLVPFLAGAFSIAALSSANIAWICVLAFIPTVFIQIIKIVRDTILKK